MASPKRAESIAQRFADPNRKYGVANTGSYAESMQFAQGQLFRADTGTWQNWDTDSTADQGSFPYKDPSFVSWNPPQHPFYEEAGIKLYAQRDYTYRPRR